MTYRAIIPVKSLREAKSRLTPYLSPSQRSDLVLDMLHHVVHILQASNVLEAVSVVSADAYVLEQAQLWGARALVEEAHGHNQALHAAALRELASGATTLLTISADLPLLQIADVRRMIELSMCYDVVLAASHEGTGTNALLVHPPLGLPYVFGPNSLPRYVEEARKRHLSSMLYKSSSIALDIDTIHDLEQFRRSESERRKQLITRQL
jgi:2-phospho-L-lactate/phosphoenolpyruvate guanylyltransferase